MIIRLYFVLFGFVLWGCGSPPSPEEIEDQYFSLDDYFGKQIALLNARQPVVEKTVRKNDQREKRTLKELDWAVELKAFRSSDINKPAWRTSYSIDSTSSAPIATNNSAAGTELSTTNGTDTSAGTGAANSKSPSAAGSTLTYRAQEDGLRVRSIHIQRDLQNKVQGIIIERAEDNYLYTSREILTYYPDSLYAIERHQKVRVLGTTEFQVSGIF